MRCRRIFGRKAGNRASTPGVADAFTAPERERVEALWRLTALPRAEFEATYGDAGQILALRRKRAGRGVGGV